MGWLYLGGLIYALGASIMYYWLRVLSHDVPKERIENMKENTGSSYWSVVLILTAVWFISFPILLRMLISGGHYS